MNDDGEERCDLCNREYENGELVEVKVARINTRLETPHWYYKTGISNENTRL